ncbi:hypothetical protein BZA77DRAFT_291913 [Pyronema omphalodes]|nr:hypothetical protein BZA77DRAFT_291913 [Pyronema omphalodes]
MDNLKIHRWTITTDNILSPVRIQPLSPATRVPGTQSYLRGKTLYVLLTVLPEQQRHLPYSIAIERHLPQNITKDVIPTITSKPIDMFNAAGNSSPDESNPASFLLNELPYSPSPAPMQRPPLNPHGAQLKPP